MCWKDRSIEGVPASDYDAALVCTPDAPKYQLLRYLLAHGKHVLVEKPLRLSAAEFEDLATLGRERRAVCYTAYNHRFEPHIARLQSLIGSGGLGRLYACRLFYGNGTARLVRASPWRDQGDGVISDLGSHLLDMVLFLFGDRDMRFRLVAANRFETNSPDHAILHAKGSLDVTLEMMMTSWRNDFVCDVYGEAGSAHIRSLCKWGPSTFTHRKRVLPSGRPPEEAITLIQDDPTWQLEYEHFRGLCAAGNPGNLANDRWLDVRLGELAGAAA